MKLTNTSCKSAKPAEKPYKLADGGGMYLEIMPNGSKYWRLKYRFTGKEKRLALGVYPETSLADARERREQARKVLAAGNDPGEVKKEAKRLATLQAENSFEAIAREWHENQLARWNAHHAASVWRRLEVNIFPAIGSRPIVSITAPELLAAIRIIEKRGAHDVSHRSLQTTGQVFRYAIATGRAERDISADLRGALKTAKKNHYAHLETSELPEFLRKLEAYDGERQTLLGLKLMVLMFVRTGELRGAWWKEVDFDKAEWRIPAERMKAKEPHIVPLSRQTIAALRELKQLTGHGELLFPSRSNAHKCISENTLLYAIYRMGYHNRTTTHGFRALASTILNEMGFRPDVIERQLAHGERNKVRAAYNHAQYLPERKKMMQHWADYIDGIASGEVPDTSNVVKFGKQGKPS